MAEWWHWTPDTVLSLATRKRLELHDDKVELEEQREEEIERMKEKGR